MSSANEVKPWGRNGDGGLRQPFTAREGRHFGLTVGLAFLALAALSWWRGKLGAPTGPEVLAGVGALLAIAGLAIPALLGPVYRAWMALAMALSRVTTPLFLGIVYFIVIVPTGALMRLFGRAPLRVQPAGSYWVRRQAGVSGDLHRQF